MCTKGMEVITVSCFISFMIRGYHKYKDRKLQKELELLCQWENDNYYDLFSLAVVMPQNVKSHCSYPQKTFLQGSMLNDFIINATQVYMLKKQFSNLLGFQLGISLFCFYFSFWQFFFSDLLCSRFCSKFQYFAQISSKLSYSYLTVTSYTLYIPQLHIHIMESYN